MVKMVPFEPEARNAQPARLGFLNGEFQVPEDFDRMGEDEIGRLFGGGE